MTAANQQGVPLTRVRFCFQTHPHADHLDTAHFLSRSQAYGVLVILDRALVMRNDYIGKIALKSFPAGKLRDQYRELHHGGGYGHGISLTIPLVQGQVPLGKFGPRRS